MKKYLPVFILIAGLFAIGLATQSATILFPGGGGTGTSTPPSYGKLLVGNSSGTYTLTATSSLGITASVSAGTYDSYGQATNTLNTFLTPYYATTTHPNISSLPSLSITSAQMSDIANYWDNRFNGTTTDALTGGSTNLYWSNNLADVWFTASSTMKMTNLTVTGTLTGTLTGNADSATVLDTARNINGVAFDGSGNITINAASSTLLANNNLFAGNNVFGGTLTVGSDTGFAYLTSGLLSASSTLHLGTGTTTSNNGLDITAGCFAVNGTCVGGGGGSGTVTQINTTWPIIGGAITTTGTLTFGGLSTSSAAVISNIPYFSGVNTFANVATSSMIVGKATILETARTINGTSFDGSANITITAASSTLLANFNTWGGANTFASTLTGTLTGKADTADKLQTARNINGVAFDGTAAITINAASSTLFANANTWAGANTFASTLTGTLTGNADTATKLATARAINGVNFDGSAAITIASTTLLANNNTFTGLNAIANASTTALTANTKIVRGDRFVTFGHSTSSWNGTTTQYLAPAVTGEIWTDVVCETDTGTVGVSIYDGTNRMDYIKTASSTINTFTLGTNNTFTVNETRRVDMGTPATTPTKLSCKARYYINE